MSDTTIDSQAPEAEIAAIEKAIGDKTESAEQTEEQKLSAFEELAKTKNFGSPDDLAEAYKNLESKMNPTMRELKDLKKMVESIQESTKPAEVDPFADLPEEQKGAIDLLDRLLEQKLSSKLSPLIKKAEVEEADKKIQAIKGKYPGVQTQELESAFDIMEKYPKMSLEDAVKIATYDRASKSASANSSRTETEQRNKRAFSESASSARKGDDTDYSKMTLEELEDVLNIPANQR
jgi:tRNA C32,U32 (ribose-2'-O)-methylase TrmJ